MTKDEYVTKFKSLLRYVPYIREEKTKVQHFVSSLQTYMKQGLQFDKPKTMDKAIQKAQIFYLQMKQK